MVSVFTDSDTIKIYIRADPTSYTTTNTYDVSYTLKEDDVTSSEVTLGTFSSSDIPVIVLSDLNEVRHMHLCGKPLFAKRHFSGKLHFEGLHNREFFTSVKGDHSSYH